MKALKTNGTSASELFQLFRDGRPRTRSELASATGLARSTIALRLDELIELGLLRPIGDALSTGGRPPALVELNPDARVVAAVEFGATHAIVAITNVVGTSLVQIREDLEIARGPEYVLDWLTDKIAQLIEQTKRPLSDLAAIGVGLPGPVAHETGMPTDPPIMPGWDGFDVPRYIGKAFSVPVLVDNDVNIMALGEREISWRGFDHIMFVKVSTGIGAGIISGGHLQRGAQGIAGDIGHIRVPGHDDVACTCGNHGCLEAVAGGPAIAAGLRDQGYDARGVGDVVDLLRSGNLAAIQAARQAGRDIGEVLTTCVSLVNPSVIALGGSLAQTSEHLMAGVREVIYRRSMPLATKHLIITQSRIGDRAGVVGASLMAVEACLSTESIQALTKARRVTPNPRVDRQESSDENAPDQSAGAADRAHLAGYQMRGGYR